MEQNFRRAADAVRLPEEARARIRAQIASHGEKQEVSVMKTKKHLPRLAVAAILIAAVLTLTAAAAAVVHQFRNNILVSDSSEIPEPQGDMPVAVVVKDPTRDGEAPKTLEEMLAEEPHITMDEWRSGEKIGNVWDTSELISDDAALCIRRITRAEDGAEMMQYMAEDPADLLPMLTGKLRFDLRWLSEHYSVIIPDNEANVIRDADGQFVSEFFWASYGVEGGPGWVRLEMDYDTTHDLSPAYLVDGTFDEAYYYTTSNGYEFLITSLDGSVSASCTTARAHISISGAYLTTKDMEQIVEHLSLSISE